MGNVWWEEVVDFLWLFLDLGVRDLSICLPHLTLFFVEYYYYYGY